MVLLEVVKKNQRMVALSLFLGITIAFLDNFSIGYFEQLVNQFATDDLDVRTILIYGSVLTLVCLLKYGQEYPDGKLSNGLYLDFKVGALDKISRIDYAEYQNLGTGLVIQKIENGATAGKSIIFNFYLTVLKELFPAILFSLVFIYRINKPITYLLLIGYVFVFMASHLLLTFLYKMKNHVLLNEERFNSRLVRGLTEVVVFRLNRQYPNELKLLRRYQKEIVASKTKMTLIHEAFFTLFALFIIIIKLMILVFAWQSQTISVGAVIALLGLVDNAYQPVAIFNVLFVQFKLDELAYERYNNLIHLPQDPHLSTGKNCRLTDEELRFTNVGFSYGQRTILSNLTLSIAPGEHIALVGASGSGKSTVLKLLIGLLKPTEGDIWLGSQPLSEVCLDRYYENVVYVSQESPLFMGSLRENIVFDHDVDDELILEALKAVCLIDWYKKLPQGLNTNIGEKGITLSGGERQRLVLARLWFQRCTLVIMDEATSAIDTLTERDVLKNIRALLVNQTVITITHRLHGIDAKERTLVFKEGQVIADGQFEILKQTSPYLQLLIQTSNQEQ